MKVIRVPRPAFFAQAACRGGDPDMVRLFFPARGGSTRRAIAICADCPVRIPCLQHALDHPELQGIWGGATNDDRDRIRRRRTA